MRQFRNDFTEAMDIIYSKHESTPEKWGLKKKNTRKINKIISILKKKIFKKKTSTAFVRCGHSTYWQGEQVKFQFFDEYKDKIHKKMKKVYRR